MTADQYLSSPTILKAEIASDMDNLAALRAIAENCTTNLEMISGGKPSGGRGKMEAFTASLEDEEKLLQDKIAALAVLEQEVLNVIRQIPDAKHRGLLLMRYISGMSWPEIAKALYTGKSYIFTIRRDALKAVDKILQAKTEQKG